TVTRYEIVTFGYGCFGLHCTHGDEIRIVTRRRGRTVALGTLRVVPSFVTGGGHHDNAGLPGSFDRLTERIDRVAFKNGTAQRKVHHANVVLIFEADRAVNSFNYVAVSTDTIVIENAEINDFGSWRHPEVFMGGILAGAGNDARHMRAVAILLIRNERNESFRIDDAAGKIGRVRNTTVNNSNTDSGTIISVAPGDVGTYGRVG